MRNLRYLWHQKFADNDSFSKLKKLNIGYCSKLSVVFPSNAYGRFLRLESLEVSNCCGLEEIYEYKAHTSYEAFALRHVYIRDLRSLKHIWSTDMDEAFISFQNLQSVRVDFCPDLKYVFPESMSCGLLQLQHLEIDNCGVEMIIAEPKHQGSEGASTSTRDFEWPKLESFKVSDCSNLNKFGSNIYKARDNIPTQDLHYSNQKVQSSELFSIDT
ncbi:hypothetical protein M5689_022846 [Euphorbia peplus]|nr:hypothetical protein M5689_022846 [Euphorbia peplus]